MPSEREIVGHVKHIKQSVPQSHAWLIMHRTYSHVCGLCYTLIACISHAYILFAQQEELSHAKESFESAMAAQHVRLHGVQKSY